ncbi:transposase [Thermoanaerobacterium thermosaccharolyticum]|jgi:IS4 transposase|uniref:transposase n=1 Tax=Thermoanaerobacterium thermosaccharolyticum TaxID=1517 RepID=UPI001CE3415D|nr:transposase [Thermoanaerobacterium thermosaccharolyticum]
MNISVDKIIRIYGKRWGIEAFFKICKSNLKLSKECKSLSYDAMTAHTVIVFTRYMMLSVVNLHESDPRAIG